MSLSLELEKLAKEFRKENELELEEGGQKFFATSYLAKESGYDQDHIGLLIRQGKIKGVRSGKKWFALPESLQEYKNRVEEQKKLNALKSITIPRRPIAPSTALSQTADRINWPGRVNFGIAIKAVSKFALLGLFALAVFSSVAVFAKNDSLRNNLKNLGRTISNLGEEFAEAIIPPVKLAYENKELTFRLGNEKFLNFKLLNSGLDFVLYDFQALSQNYSAAIFDQYIHPLLSPVTSLLTRLFGSKTQDTAQFEEQVQELEKQLEEARLEIQGNKKLIEENLKEVTLVKEREVITQVGEERQVVTERRIITIPSNIEARILAVEQNLKDGEQKFNNIDLALSSVNDRFSYTPTILIPSSGGDTGRQGVTISNPALTDSETVKVSNLLDVSGDAQIARSLNVDSGTFYVNPTDNRVGIGTTSLETALEVVGTASISGDLSLAGALTITGGTQFSSSASVSGNFEVGTNKFYVDSSNGRVGINTQNLTEALEVVGNASISGGLTVLGNIGIGTTSTPYQLTVIGSGSFTGQLKATRNPTLAHTGTWPSFTNTADATFYLNPSAPVADGNIIAYVSGTNPKFVVDAEGDTFIAGNLTLSGTTTQATTAVTGDLTVEGNSRLGDAQTDVIKLSGTIRPRTLTSFPVLVKASASQTVDVFRILDPNDNVLLTLDQGTGLLTASSGFNFALGGSTATVSYSRLGTNATTYSNNLSRFNDFLISGNLEVDDKTFLDSTLEVQGTASASYFLTGNTLQVGGFASAAYSRFGTSTLTTNPAGNWITGSNDLLISGDLYGIGSIAFAGPASISNTLFVGTGGKTGNVGIGTTGPTRLFQVVSTTTGTGQGDGANRSIVFQTSQATPRIGGIYEGSNNDIAIGAISNHPVVFVSNNAQVGTWNSTGLLVGVEALTPSFPLEINTSGSLARQLYITTPSTDATGIGIKNTSTGANRDWIIAEAGSSNLASVVVPAGNLFIYDLTAGATRLTINSSGRVGIGTTSPDSIFEVSSASSNFIIRSTGSTSSASIDFQPAGGASSSNQGKFTIRAGGLAGSAGERLDILNGASTPTVLMTIASSGFVGIGTTGPTNLLDLVVNDANNSSNINLIRAAHTSTSTAANGLGSGILFVGEDNDASSGGVAQSLALVQGIVEDVASTSFDAGLAIQVNKAGTGLFEAVRVNSLGNLGIGTTTPSSLLTVQGRGEFQGTASASYLLTGNTLQVGGFASAAYSRFGTATTTHAGTISGISDLLISGGLEVNGSAAFDGFTLLNSNASVSGNFELTGSSPLFGINAGNVINTNLEVGGTASVSSTLTLAGIITSNNTGSNSFSGGLEVTKGVHATGSITTGDALRVNGNTTLGDATGDILTANADSWTFVNDTNFVLSGGTNGLSFDTSTFSIDATSNRVGILTTTPSTTFEVQGTASASYLLTGNTLQVGGFASAAYSRFGTATTGHSNYISTTNDLLISGDLEVRGSISANIASISQMFIMNNTASASAFFKSNGSGGTIISMFSIGVGNGTERLNIFDNNNSPIVTIASGGNVGIGTTNPSLTSALGEYIYAPTTTNAKLKLESTVSNGYGAIIDFVSKTTGGSSTTWQIGTGIVDSKNAWAIYNDALGTAAVYIASASGNVGIGITSPQVKLQAGNTTNSVGVESRTDGVDVGGVAAANVSRIGGFFQGATAPNAAITFGAQGSTGGQGALEFATSPTNVLSTQPTVRMVIDKDGNVGIGTTGPSAKLDIRKASETGANPGVGEFLRLTATDAITDGDKVALTFNMVSSYMASIRGQAVGTDETSSLIFATSNAGVGGDRMTITGAGNVGIGTTNPGGDVAGVLLDVRGNMVLEAGTPRLYWRETAQALNNKQWDLQVSGTTLLGRLLSDDNSVGVQWLNVERSGTTVTDVNFPNGNVGIGTTVPLDVLHVVGDIRTSACASDGAGDVACVDVAETFIAGDNLEAGDVVAVKDAISVGIASSSYALVKARGSVSSPQREDNFGTGTIGIVSTSPAVLIEGNQARFGGPKVAGVYAPRDKAPVALAGRVPVKVSLENGEIKPGDRLTVSKTLPGYAMKQTEAGQSIGVALEGLTTSDVGATSDVKKITVFVNLGYWAPADSLASTSNILTQDSSAIFDLDILFNSIVKKFYEAMNIVFEQGLVRVANVIVDKITAKEVAAEKLCIGSTCVTEQELKALLEKSQIPSTNFQINSNDQNSNTETPTPSPSEPPTPEPTPSENPTPTPEPSPSESPTPTPEPSPSESPTPEPTPEATPEPTPEPSPSPSL